MRQETFHAFCRLIREHCGQELTHTKLAFVKAKVGSRTVRLGLSEEAYLALLQEDGEELVSFLDSLLTNVTKFFRAPAQFDLLRAELQRRFAQGQRQFTLWSTACATGEEAWSMAIVAAQVLDGTGASFRLLATDLSASALVTARAGVYGEHDLKELSGAQRRFFEVAGDDGFRVREPLRAKVSFARLNLAHPPYPLRGPFDVIFCRNVMMYFGVPERQALVLDLERLLAADGRLMVSYAEGLSHLKTGLAMLNHSLYYRPHA